ncbi:MAG: hypothetical protein GF398_00430 [Chitinivibrionales bacterium]|nr:hypothetical protein [Chitinivibrionales bacterium]
MSNLRGKDSSRANTYEMRKSEKPVLLLFAIIINLIADAAQNHEYPAEHNHHVPQVAGICIDGDGADWRDEGFVVSMLATGDGKIAAGNDLDVQVRIAWDSTGMLFYVAADDDRAYESITGWIRRNDNVSLVVKDAADESMVFRLQVRPGRDPRLNACACGVHRHVIDGQQLSGIKYDLDDWRSVDQRKRALRADVAGSARRDGYAIEARLPWRNMLISAPAGYACRLSVEVTDRDSENARRTRYSWKTTTDYPFGLTQKSKLLFTDSCSPPVVSCAFGTYAPDGSMRVTIGADASFDGKACSVASGYRQIAQTFFVPWQGNARASFTLPPQPVDHRPQRLTYAIDAGRQLPIRVRSVDMRIVMREIERIRKFSQATQPLQTSWTQDDERGFIRRGAEYFDRHGFYYHLNTGADREKWSYPRLMASAIAGDRQKSLGLLQQEDREAQTHHRHTLGIDWYWCFTIKGQVRKYFLFGHMLDSAYRRTMYESAKIWAQRDPIPRFELINVLKSENRQVRAHVAGVLQKMTGRQFGDDVGAWRDWWRPWSSRPWVEQEEEERRLNIRPHPIFGKGKPGIGNGDDWWGPDVRGSWVDGRNTPNLRAMRETSVYLMAEETGNEMTRMIYKQKLINAVSELYHIGHGEFESENYLPHSITPYLNLYDFARDRQVKLLAKAALDWLIMSGALKYYRGGFGGPTMRDFGGATHVFGSEATHPLWLYFGDCPLTDPRPRYDDLHTLTSTYRPPRAIVELARKNFAKPVELFNTKPHYDGWKPGLDEKPVLWETMFFDDGYYLGTTASGGYFKFLAYDSARGVDYFLANSSLSFGLNYAENRIAQNRNSAIWLRPAGADTLYLQVPDKVEVIAADSVWIFAFEKCAVALAPLNLGTLVKSPHLPITRRRKNRYYNEHALYALPATKDLPYFGFVLYAAKRKESESIRAFAARCRSNLRVEKDSLPRGVVKVTAPDGRQLTMRYAPDDKLPRVIRDGKARDWEIWDVFRPVDSHARPVSQGWKKGALRVRAGKYALTQTVTAHGKVTFTDSLVE